MDETILYWIIVKNNNTLNENIIKINKKTAHAYFERKFFWREN